MRNYYDLINTLFDPEDLICPANDIYRVATMERDGVWDTVDFHNNWGATPQYVSINPFKRNETRADKSVAKFRNFLVELDKTTIEEQRTLIKQTLKMPWSTETFSGNKSMHYVISLKTPVSAEEYREMALRLHNVVGLKGVIDPTSKNPSRFTRFGGGFNHKTGNCQEFIINERIDNQVFLDWLDKHSPKLTPREVEVSVDLKDLPTGFKGRLSAYTLKFIREGATENRNQSLYRAACDLCQNNYSQEQAEQLLSGTIEIGYDFTEREFLNTINSAYLRTDINPKL